MFCKPDALHTGLETQQDFLSCCTFRLQDVAEKRIKTATCRIYGPQVMPEFSQKKNVIVLCDRWYMKKSIVSVVDEYPNLDLIGNARSDSVIYDLAPAPTGNFVISEGIRKQIFFTGFVQNIETQIKSKSVISAIKQAFRKHGTIYKVVKWYVFI